MSLVQMLMWSGVITDNNVRSLLVCGDLYTCHHPRTGNPSKAYYQAFFRVLIDLIVELFGLIIKPFDNQTES
jgi:hypothetical protein